MWKFIVVCVCAFMPVGFASVLFNEESDAKEFFIHPKDRGNGTISPRIIGGAVVAPHAYPSQVALVMSVGKDNFFCGGSLLSNEWVLTAAHCLSNKPDFIMVILGAHDLSKIDSSTGVVALKATKYKYHSGWDEKTFQNDVGLVRLPNNVTYTQYIKPVKLANNSSKLYVGETGTIVGWGATKAAGDITTVLRSVRSPVLSNDACSKTNTQYTQLIKPMHLCTSGYGIVGSCNGDSGGPLYINGVQIGIVSFGPNNCEIGWPSVFTRVTSFNDWIAKHAVDGATSFDRVMLAATVLVTLCLVNLVK